VYEVDRIADELEGVQGQARQIPVRGDSLRMAPSAQKDSAKVGQGK